MEISDKELYEMAVEDCKKRKTKIISNKRKLKKLKREIELDKFIREQTILLRDSLKKQIKTSE